MNILETILSHKESEVHEQKNHVSIRQLEQSLHFQRPCYSLRQRLMQNHQPEIIAEIKRKSPSKGAINSAIDVGAIAAGYEKAGAAALSILTDSNFFGGSTDDVMLARTKVACPILRKDFMIDEYQVLEAKAIGADVILLIAAALSPEKIKSMTALAHSLGLEVLLEVHNQTELLANLDAMADMIGVNNRDLRTFQVDTNRSIELSKQMPAYAARISESGIEHVETISNLYAYGFHGFLMGQAFMQEPDPAKAADDFIAELRFSSLT